MKGSISPNGGSFIVKYPTGIRGKRIQRRCSTLAEAERLLNALRYHDDEGTLDPRDFLAQAPLAFDKQTREWLARVRKSKVKTKTWKNYTLYMGRAIEAWDDRNLKGIRRGDIQDLIDSFDVGEKSKANMVSCLSTFWRWLLASEIIRPQDVPQFPQVKFKLGIRKTVTKEVQGQILDEIYRQTYERNPKIWLGVKWLATYVCLRPGDLFRIRERDIDRRNRVVYIRDPKCAEPYELPLTTQDVEALLRIAPGAPDEPFFRHTAGVSGVAEKEPFGGRYFYKHWKKACDALGIEGVDLYGGTRHSSARAMRRTHSPEQIKWATKHRTSKAFERYFQMDDEDLREMYEQAESCTTLVPPFQGSSRS